MKYIAYIRKSTEGKNRQIQSIPKQYNWVKREAERRGITISMYFEDKKSGHTLGREGFENMVQTIETSNEPVGIITWKISRLSRNPIDEGIIKYAFMRGKIKHIIARDREYKERENQIIMGVDFGQATQYSIELSKDVIEGMDKKVSKGYRPTKAPYGYINEINGTKGEKKILVDDKYFKPIQKFLRMFSSGAYTVSELREIMTEKWGIKNRAGRPFSNSTLYLILKRRFYCGQYVWKGQIKQGKHKPMITVEEYLNIQNLINGKNKFVKNKYENHFSGQISCGECQSGVTGYSKVKNNRYKGISTYHYLKCTKSKATICNEKNINRTIIDNQIIELLDKLFISEKIVKHVLKLFEEREQVEIKQKANTKSLLKKQLHGLEGELSVLTRKLSQGIIDDDIFIKMNKNINEEINTIQIKLKSLDNENNLSKIKDFFSFLTTAKEKFKTGSYQDKKMIIKTLGSNFYLKAGKLFPELHIPFIILEKNRKHSSLKKREIEPQKNRSTKGKNGFFDSENLSWSSSWEKLRTSILSESFIIYTILYSEK